MRTDVLLKTGAVSLFYLSKSPSDGADYRIMAWASRAPQQRIYLFSKARGILACLEILVQFNFGWIDFMYKWVIRIPV